MALRSKTSVQPWARGGFSAARKGQLVRPLVRRTVRFRGSDLLQVGLDHSLPFTLHPPHCYC